MTVTLYEIHGKISFAFAYELTWIKYLFIPTYV